MRTATRPIPAILIAGLVILQGLSVALIAAGYPVVVAVIACAALGGAIAISSLDLRLMALAMIPLTQPLVLGRGTGALALYPEYVVIPVAFLIVVADRVRNGRITFQKSGLVLPAILFLFVAAISLVHAIMQEGFGAATKGIATLYVHVMAFLFLVMALELYGPRYSVRKIFYWMFAASLVVSLLGVAEYLALGGLPGKTFRAGSTMGIVFAQENRGNPNVLAAYVVMMSLMALAMMSNAGTKVRLYLSGGVLLHLVALMLTGSRSGAVALVGGVVWLALQGRRRLLFWIIPAAAIGITIAANIPRMFQRYTSILSIVTSGDLIKFFLRVDPKSLDWNTIGYFGMGGFDIDTLAGANRFAAWVLGIRTFFDHPILGIGFQMNLQYTGFSTSENYFLDIAVMTGLLGFGLFMVWIARVYSMTRKALRGKLDKDEKAFVQGFSAVCLAMAVISLTGSVFLTLKLMLIFLTWTALLWHVASRAIRWRE